jgi:hypothetical protein
MACICLPASMPSMSGIARSSRTKSGLSLRNLLTPDLPFSASPQTVHRELFVFDDETAFRASQYVEALCAN